MSNGMDVNSSSTLSRAQRIIQVLDHLGIERAHFGAMMPEDWGELASTYPDRICSLTVVCPEVLDIDKLQALAAQLLVIAGDQPPVGRQIANALSLLPGAQYLALKGFSNLVWDDPIADRYDAIASRFLNFLESMKHGATMQDNKTLQAATGDLDGVSYQVQGHGEPLVLLPLELSPTQWDKLLPILREQYTTVLLGGPELGVLPILEQRGRSAGYQQLLRNMLHALQPQPGETILDVGCGSGVVDRWLASYTGGRNPILGIDLNPYLLKEAAELVRKERYASVLQLREGNATALPLPDNAYDVVISTTVMEEVDADAMLAELVRVTKPAGRIGVVVRAMDLPRPSSILVRPELKMKCDAPPTGSVAKSGCAGIDLYKRFHHIGLSDIRVLPDWTVFSDAHGSVETFLQRLLIARLAPSEAEEWRAAALRAAQDGTFFMTWPHHCAVGTKPAG